MNGNDIIIQTLTNGVYRSIAGTKSHDVESTADSIEVSSPSQGQYAEYRAGMVKWQVGVTYLVLESAGILDLLKVRQKFRLLICDRQKNTTLYGDAILMKCKQTYTRGTLVQGSFNFVGSGPLEQIDEVNP